jgi:hypothetical protein
MLLLARISHKETENRGQKLLKSILHKYSSSLSMVINVPGLPWVLAKQKQFLIDISRKECRDVPWNVYTRVVSHAYLIFTRCLMNKFLVSRKGAKKERNTKVRM